jgi:phosphoserine aminotransferase
MITNRIETDFAKEFLGKQSSKMMRDFRDIQLQRNSSDREKSFSALEAICTKDISYNLRKMTKYNVYDSPSDKDEYYWLIKTIDGEKNFICGLPIFCSSASLIHNKAPILSVVNVPMTNSVFYCEKEGGVCSSSFHDNGMHRISSCSRLSEATLCVNFDSDMQNTRVISCNTLGYVYVALGNLDGFIMDLGEFESKIAELFIKEAGGVFSRIGNLSIGSNKLIHEDLRNIAFKKMGIDKEKSISFSCGPTQKPSNWKVDIFNNALIAQSNWTAEGLNRVKDVLNLTRDVLQIPSKHKIVLINGSATGATECALYNFLGTRPIQNLAYDVFGRRWGSEISRICNFYEKKYSVKINFSNIMYDKQKITKGDTKTYEAQIDKNSDLVLVHSGTSNGFAWTNNALLKRNKDDGLVICDAVASAFIEDIPWKDIDVGCFSFQKGLGAEAGLGCVVLNEKALDFIKQERSMLVAPRIMHLTEEMVRLSSDEGYLINSISMLHIEEIRHHLAWAKQNGGLPFLKETCIKNQTEIIDLVNKHSNKVKFLLEDPNTRSKAVLAVIPTNPVLQNWDFIRKVSRIAEKYNLHAIEGLSEEVPCWRFWTGPTMQRITEGFNRFLNAFDRAL